MKEPKTPLGMQLMKMAKYPEYQVLLDTPGLAFEFNEFCKIALELEDLVLKADKMIASFTILKGGTK